MTSLQNSPWYGLMTSKNSSNPATMFVLPAVEMIKRLSGTQFTSPLTYNYTFL